MTRAELRDLMDAKAKANTEEEKQYFSKLFMLVSKRDDHLSNIQYWTGKKNVAEHYRKQNETKARMIDKLIKAHKEKRS